MLIKTLCKDCIHAITSSDQQIGCEIGILDKIPSSIIEDMEVDNFKWKSFTRTCPHRSYSEPKDPFVPINLVIKADSNIDKLVKTLDSLKESGWRKHNIIVCIYDKQIMKSVITECSRRFTNYFVMTLLVDENDDILINESFKKCMNGYVTIINSGFEVPAQSFSRLNQAINYDMKKVCYVLPVDENDNMVTFLAFLFKAMKGNQEEPFINKIFFASKEVEYQTIFQWSEI